MKCIRCGYESSGQFSQCPRCGTVQNAPQNNAQTAPQYSYSPYQTNAPAYSRYSSAGQAGRTRTAGETAAILIAVIVSVVSVIAAFIIFVASISYRTAKTLEQYGIDSIDDFDSNEFSEDDLENFFRDYYSKDGGSQYNSESPAGLNTPIQFNTKLYSFSEGEIQTEYEVSMTAAYRGEAALKMLEGAALPTYDKDGYDVYLARFNVKITDQDKDAIVTLPMNFPAAYPSNTVSLFSSEYKALSSLSYVNQYSLVSKGEEVETYIAFIVAKEDSSPCIRWNLTEDKVFRSEEEAVSDASSVEAGAALETKDESSDSDSSDGASSY